MSSTKTILFLLLTAVLLVVACNHDDLENDNWKQGESYRIKALNFYLTEEDQNVFTLDYIDTVRYVNPGNSTLPDTTFYPYHSIRDSLFIELSLPSGLDFSIQDSIAFRHPYIGPDREIVYRDYDTLYISRAKDQVLFPVDHKQEAITLKKPAPKNRYEISGNYWRIRYSISFEAETVGTKTKKETTLEGKLHYSVVSRGDRPEGSENTAPGTFIKATDIP